MKAIGIKMVELQPMFSGEARIYINVLANRLRRQNVEPSKLLDK